MNESADQPAERPRTIRVVFLCAAGMSSSLIKNKVESLAARQGVSVELEAIPSMLFETVDYASGDVVLLGPGVRGQLPAVLASASKFGLPVETIGFREYGLVDAEAILRQILRMDRQRREASSGS
jgi:PTS system cellobiose-specific IIB component